jgi:thiol-disulfide isomerase/thioredoxin
MARTESKMLPLGTPAPEFRLPDTVSGKPISLDQIAGEHGTLVMFICNHCPFVKHVLDELVRLGKDYRERGIGLVAISSNDITGYPQDRPERMKALAARKGLSVPLLVRRVAKHRTRLRRRLHPRLLPVRSEPQTRLPRPARRFPPRQQCPGQRQGYPHRPRCPARRQADLEESEALDRLQYQVEGVRAGFRVQVSGFRFQDRRIGVS